jgi:hypothetical protein
MSTAQESEEDAKPAISPMWIGIFAFLVIGSGTCPNVLAWYTCLLSVSVHELNFTFLHFTAVFQIITQSQGSLLG